MTSIKTLSRGEILTTALFYADSGVHWLFESPNEAEHESITIHDSNEQDTPIKSTSKSINTDLDINNSIIQKSYSISECASSLHELKSLLSSFNDCNLQNTACETICADQECGHNLMIIGYTPSDRDNINGKPFSGKSGNMLGKMLKSIDISREETCISMISPWHPPGNRKLSTMEIEICRPIILKQISLVAPKIILLLGSDATKFFFNNDKTTHRDLVPSNNILVNKREITTISTVHPQEMIDYPIIKKIAWHDLLLLKKALKTAKINMNT